MSGRMMGEIEEELMNQIIAEGMFRPEFLNRFDGVVLFQSLTEEEMRRRLLQLKIEHRDLDAAIAALTEANPQDQLQVARLKKRKLRLKDQISMIDDYLTPDIIA